MLKCATGKTGGLAGTIRLTAAGLFTAAALLTAPPVQAGNSGTIVCMLNVITGQINQEMLREAAEFNVPAITPAKPGLLPGLSGPEPAPLSRPMPQGRDVTVSSLAPLAELE